MAILGTLIKGWRRKEPPKKKKGGAEATSSSPLFQGLFIKVIKCRNHRKTPNQLRNQAVANQILGLDVAKHLAFASIVRTLDVGFKADAAALGSSANNLVQTFKSAAANEEDVRGIDRNVVSLRVLSSACCRNVGNGAFNEL